MTIPADEHARLRTEVRAFLAEQAGRFEPRVDGWFFGFDRAFTRALAERGWVAMTWPREYGGHERSPEERFVVIEELLAAGAPLNAHWVPDRQFGPLLLRFGTEELKRRYLPRVAAGELVVALGMSEPGAGSDLAAVTTAASRVPGGWRLDGTKIWTGNAHEADIIVVLCRTSPEPEPKGSALSQLIVEMDSPGITVRRIPTMSGSAHFCEVRFDGVFVPESMLVGEEGRGWPQVLEELSFERGGPERYMSTFILWARLVALLPRDLPTDVAHRVGAAASRLSALRALALSLLSDSGSDLAARAAVFKEMSTRFETELTEEVRTASRALRVDDAELDALLASAVRVAPASTLRGGTTEIMHGIAARALLGAGRA